MVLDVFTGLLIAIGAGGALGALSSLLGWASSGEPFEGKKMAIAVTTGIIAGIAVIALSFPAVKASIAADSTGVALIELMIPIALSIVGTDMIRSKLSGAIANRATENAAVVAEEPTAPA